MTINQSRINRLEAKLAPKNDLSRSPLIVHVEKGPNDNEQTMKARIQAAVGDNSDGRHVVVLILEHSREEKPDLPGHPLDRSHHGEL